MILELLECKKPAFLSPIILNPMLIKGSIWNSVDD